MSDRDEEFQSRVPPALRDARRMIQDPDAADQKWYEQLFHDAAKGAADGGVPSEEFDPLLRLVRSYVRGSYREPPASDVAWAIAALIVVGRGGALNPMRLVRIPRLRPDLRTVRWVRRRIADTLAAYENWESMVGGSRTPLPARIEAPAITSLDVRVLEPQAPTLFETLGRTTKPSGPPVAANPLVAGADGLYRALRAGNIMRVVGPPEVLEGLESGALELVKSGSHNLGIARDAVTKEFVAPLDFGDIEPSSVAGPALAAFQMASAVTLQYYLARIDRQLGEISRELDAVRADTQDDRFGKIETARDKCSTVERVLTVTGTVGAQDALRLELATNDLEQTYQALRSNAEKFCARVERIEIATVEKSELEELLGLAAGSQLTDLRLLLYAAVVRHRINGVQVVMHAVDGPERVALAHREEAAAHEDMLALLARVGAAIRALNLPKRSLDARWPVLGGPERELVAFSDATRTMREQLTSPTDALPALMPTEPFVMDLKLGEGDRVEAKWAYVRSPRSD